MNTNATSVPARTYYNEHDPKKAAWLRELIADGQITPGDVDERSIADVSPGDVRGYTRCHWFAGIGVWDYALDLAGWGDEPVWTGSCPCPSFSAAGKGQGFDDPRHIWPDWARLIRECHPPAIFGEQADDAIGFGWLDLVQTDLEAEAYAVGKAVLGACSVGAPHIRQRLFFVADATGERPDGRWTSGTMRESGTVEEPERLRDVGGMGDTSSEGLPPCERGIVPGANRQHEGRAVMQSSGSPWATALWLPCKDGKLRAVEPVPESLAPGTADLLGRVCDSSGSFFHPLQVKAPARRLRLHGYGDAIVAPLAAEFIQAFLEARHG